jgi:L-threonylcarbamoyladenylate synthase
VVNKDSESGKLNSVIIALITMAELGNDIEKALTLLKRGELVAIPTETVYGLAGNALDVTAIAKIFAVKNRPKFDPLIVHVTGVENIPTFVKDVPVEGKELATRFWPGPLTLVLKKNEIIPDLVTAGMKTVGIRCPNHFLTLKLLASLSFPLAAPSANPFGFTSPTCAEHVQEQLGDSISYILDGGPCNIGVESTIVGFEETPTNNRLGGLTLEKNQAVVGKVNVKTHSTTNPLRPGQNYGQ